MSDEPREQADAQAPEPTPEHAPLEVEAVDPVQAAEADRVERVEAVDLVEAEPTADPGEADPVQADEADPVQADPAVAPPSPDEFAIPELIDEDAITQTLPLHLELPLKLALLEASEDLDDDFEDDLFDDGPADDPATPRRVAPAPPPPGPRPPTVVQLIRPNSAVILLGLLCALALIESIAAFLEYRERIDEGDWEVVEQLLEAHEGEPLIVVSEWLGPSARMHVARARSWDSLAFPDLRGFSKLWLLTHARERPWRGPLRAELEGLPRPLLVKAYRVGELTLHEYSQVVGTVDFSLLDSIHGVSTARGPCPASGGQYRCKEGRVSVRVIEVDYRARRCLAVELEDGAMASIDLGEVVLGDRIHGHVGFGDFNARLRADPSARLELWIDGAVAGRWAFTDDQGWAAFALAVTPLRGVEPDLHQVELRVGTTVGGTWQREGHRSSPTDTLCVELRGFTDAAPEEHSP